MNWTYLVGGLRISLRDDTTTPGPRSHILGFTTGLKNHGISVNTFVASEQRGMARFARIREGSTAGSTKSKVAVGDIVRIATAAYLGGRLFLSARKADAPDVIYERAAVFQWLNIFHPRRKASMVIVESNGLMAEESLANRNAIVLLSAAQWVERQLYKSADLVIAVSPELSKSIVRTYSIPASKIIVVQNGIGSSLADIPPCRPTDKFIIGFAGAVVPWQNLDLLVRAAQIAAQEPRTWKALPIHIELIGDGPDLTALRQQTLNLPEGLTVAILGRLPREETIQRMASWHAAYCGHGDSAGTPMYHSPLKLMEYGAMGVTVLASDSIDRRQLDEFGLPVVNFSSVEHLTSCLKTLSSELPAAGSAAARAQFVAANSWESRVKVLVGEIAERERLKNDD